MNYLIPGVELMESSKMVTSKFERLKNFLFAKPRILGRRICIIGLHGWVPSKMLQRVVGLPRGTSVKFCQMMKSNLEEFNTRVNHLAYFEEPLQIDEIALEGSGCINERVQVHLGQLEDKKDILADADTIIFVAHSQGVPVAAILASQLVTDTLINPRIQNVAMLNLAGIVHGPFADLEGNLVVKYVEADAAREFFQLNRRDSELSVRVSDAFRVILEADVLVCSVASWLDQVVPLYSACLLGISHANIWRCIYIDGHNYKDDFLTELVKTLLLHSEAKAAVREAARRLLVLLTDTLCGSLYKSRAHSTLYDENSVYQTVLHWILARDRGTRGENTPAIFLEENLFIEKNVFLIPWLMKSLLINLGNLEKVGKFEKLKEMHREWIPLDKQSRELYKAFSPIHSKL